ncbi:MAG TPA: adenylate/guanylate cyclase domain-containing protein [Candidatus Limnocylindria bacterium]|nr:adenylate/guanylate cyclase domain-containing protein [Candidatus Limnocylindria bacterium]
MSSAGRPATEQRKLVSVVFADVVGSTAFGSENDPEAVRSVMGTYFERMKQIAELHGGTVEKFIGDAVMVVFGIPRLHDDDAERAVRTALAMRDAMGGLNADLGVSLQARVGVNSGETVAGSGREGQFLVTGDAVNVAARLQQGAEAGEVVVGALTESLTRSAIDYATRDAVSAKGKTDPIKAFRAVRPRSSVPEQARGLPAMRAQLVGRQRELRLLLETFERVRTDRRAHLFTLVGNAGIGKSRLVGELLARIASAGDARVLRGRVLPYGAGITYWPLMEIIREDAGITSDDDREAALAKLEVRTAALNGAHAAAVRQRLAAMLALRKVDEVLPEVSPADVSREIAWAVREHLAAAARDPAVIVIDDLQWGEPAVFEIIEGLAERAEDASLLLICVARPQLLETHPSWAAGRANAATITLDALSPVETQTLISRLLDVDDLPGELRARVVQRSEGNPLFCEEFLRMLIDEGRVERVAERWRATAAAADVRVPESIQALLAARLDGLGDEERRAIQIASIIGERFGASELAWLAPDIDVGRAIAGLRRSGLVLEDRETRESGRYRFKHLLMRDVAYGALPKAARADLHEVFARELERAVGDRGGEFAEIIAHHIERAFSLSLEIRAPRTVLLARARAALDRALVLGEHARRRQDIGLLRPYANSAKEALAALADAATREDRVGVALLIADERRLATAYAEARVGFEEAARLAAAMGRSDLDAVAHLGAARVIMMTTLTRADIDAFMDHVAEADRLFGEAGDEGGAIEAGIVALEELWSRGDVDTLLDRGRVLRGRAQAIGDVVRELLICGRLFAASIAGGRPHEASEYAARTDALVSQLGARRPPWSRVGKCGILRQAGDVGAALACIAEFEALAKAEQDLLLAMAFYRSTAEILTIEQRRYEQGHIFAKRGLELSIRLDEWWNRIELKGTLAVATAGLGDLKTADDLADTKDEAADIFAAAYSTFCRARVCELAGRFDEADTLYRAAEDAMGATGFRRMFWQALIHLDHAEMLLGRGRTSEAAAQFATAESILGPQQGERAARLERVRRSLRSRTTAAS